MSIFKVHCRVGSLETTARCDAIAGLVHCRVGNLENCKAIHFIFTKVHCRVGSQKFK